MEVNKPKQFYLNNPEITTTLPKFVVFWLNCVEHEDNPFGIRWTHNLNILSYNSISKEVDMNWDWAYELKSMFNIRESIEEIDEQIRQTIIEEYGNR